MITIPPTPAHKVEKIHVSSKDPHHELDKEKKDKEKQEKKEPKDKVELSQGDGTPTQSKTEKKYPDNPLKGHIDIDA